VSRVAPTLQAWFTQRLIGQRQASPHTVVAYRDTFRLLFAYMADTTGKSPAQLDFDDLDVTAIDGFLTHLEQKRGVSPATRNARLAALRSFFGFASYSHPEHAATIARVMAIPAKRTNRPLVTFLTRCEIDALLAAPDRSTSTGWRDHALLAIAVQTGLRVSELAALRRSDLYTGRGPHVRVTGKGRKERVTPLTHQTVAIVTAWLDERGGAPDAPIFPGPTGDHLGRDAIRKLVVKHIRTATGSCPSIATKQVGVHTLRHSCAMNLLHSGVDLATIALWLGHEGLRTVQHYLHADLALKERALARTTQPNTKPGRYRPSDPILAFLDSL
jgi:integrase/recombinase XerD